MPSTSFFVELRLVVLSMENGEPSVLFQESRLPFAQLEGDLESEVLRLIERVTTYKLPSLHHWWLPVGNSEPVLVGGDTIVLSYGLTVDRRLFVVPQGMQWKSLYRLEENEESQIISNVMRSLCH